MTQAIELTLWVFGPTLIVVLLFYAIGGAAERIRSERDKRD